MSLSNEAEIVVSGGSRPWRPVDPPAASFASLRLADARVLEPVDLGGVWRGLVAGESVVVDSYFTGTGCGLVLSPRRGMGPVLEGRRLAVLEAVLQGTGQKRIAIDLSLAPSTVALQARLALECLGVYTRPSRVHPLMMLAASAAVRASPQRPASQAIVEHGHEEWRAITVPRPDLSIRHLLPKAEADVVAKLVEGRCYADISHERGTSPRTTANQVAGAFRRLGVSGRNELVQRLFVLSGWLREQD